MVSVIYPKYKEAILTGTALNISTANIKVALIDTGTYTYDASHDFHDDLSGIVATSVNLAGTTVSTTGIFDASDITVVGVSGATIETLVVYYDSGVSATSRLLAYIDSGTGLPYTPDSGDITINWDNGANKIFTL